MASDPGGAPSGASKRPLVADLHRAVTTGELINGRYILQGLVGRGSMAVVFQAVDTAEQRTVAIKFSARGSAGKGHLLQNEAAILQRLDHPSVAKYLDHGMLQSGAARAPDFCRVTGKHGSAESRAAASSDAESGGIEGRTFLVQEFAHSGTLAQATASGPCPPAQVALWAEHLLSGLAHVHGRNLVHRDIKPSNLALSGLRRSPVRIIDFGVATDAGSVVVAGSSTGTVHYMSPEQAAGGDVMPAWDIYAMGLVFIECLTGAKAFPGTPIESLVARTLRNPELPAGLSPAWNRFLSALTAMDPADRPAAQEAAAIARQLRKTPERFTGPRNPRKFQKTRQRIAA